MKRHMKYHHSVRYHISVIITHLMHSILGLDMLLLVNITDYRSAFYIDSIMLRM